MKFWLAVGGLVLALCGSAQASTVIAPGSAPGPWQRWIARAKIPTPPVALTVMSESCVVNGDYGSGCSVPNEPTIYVSHQRADLTKIVFFHELGHQTDNWSLSDVEQAKFMDFVGLAGEWHQPGATSPHEVFATTYEQCAIGNWIHAPGIPLIREHQAVPLVPDMARTCALIARLVHEQV